ncbi:MAG: DUF1588 domain-containing protein [Myxococcales bacterium]
MDAGRFGVCAALLIAGCGGSIDDGVAASQPRDRSDGGNALGSGSGDDAVADDAAGADDRTDPSNPDAPFVASESVARRLSRAELDAALLDLVGDDTGAAGQNLPEDFYSPYDNDYTGQLASAALIDSISELADDVAARVVNDPRRYARLVPCTPDGPGDADCFEQVTRGLLERALRRPIDDAEVARYRALLEFATEDEPAVDNGFSTAVELLVRAVIMDPEFLYRIEVGEPTDEPGVYALDDFEIATRLSFLIWGAPPDEALYQDARAGLLREADGRHAALQRMLQDDRAREQLHRFHAMWLGYRVIPHSPELAVAFTRETGALLDRVILDEPQSYLNLLDFGETYLDELLAEHYGLPAPEGGRGWVPYGDSGRAGLLSHGSVLSAFGKFADTSPTQRGILIRTRLLCQTLPPPPPTVMADQPPGGDDATCKWDRYEQHRSSTACAGCHANMDPIGFGLENYDLAGRYREHDDGRPECTIEGTGELPPYGSFSGPAELGRLLIDSGEVERCVSAQFFQFAVGRAPAPIEEQEIDALTEDFRTAGTLFTELLESFVSRAAFALRREPVE